ncbi:hypothetical protein B0T20DRAFT_457386 [Sordaria brevicollis]|uniref:FAD-binding domain-containing protein n=1 Tax=Sordaria brevicollis TaxID=83679 RepID=A0AAE0NV25_SORBR|nr:hypothetical protein B0T20DRAFT_457386 [Sordaria brevicollis]
MTASKDPTVVIIGAGLTGLLAAQALKQHGFHVLIFDSEPHLNCRPRDWTILIHWALPLFSSLLPPSVLASFDKAIANPHLEFDEWAGTLPMYNGETGDLIFKSAVPGSRRITRRGLRDVLAEGLEIQWGRTVTKLDTESSSLEKVKVTLEGEGGIEEQNQKGGEDKAKVMRSGFMIGTCIVDYPDQSTKGSLSSTPSIPRKGPSAVRYLKQSWQGLSPEFQSFIDQTPEDDSTHTKAFIDEMGTWIAQPFDNRSGRVTLAGDAAHPMLILRGQGFQHAVTDVHNYVQALLKVRDSAADRKEVVGRYDEDMVERGSKAALQALREAELAELAMDETGVERMVMAREGHGRGV